MTIVETHEAMSTISTDVSLSPSLALPLPGDEPRPLGANAVTPLMFVAASVIAMMYVVTPLTLFLIPMLQSEIDATVVAVASSLLAVVFVRLLLCAIRAPRAGMRRGFVRPTAQAEGEFR
jgi:hypothetical protein